MSYSIEHQTDADSEDGFREWWYISNGERSFKADSEEDAKWLCELLNAYHQSKEPT